MPTGPLRQTRPAWSATFAYCPLVPGAEAGPRKSKLFLVTSVQSPCRMTALNCQSFHPLLPIHVIWDAPGWGGRAPEPAWLVLGSDIHPRAVSLPLPPRRTMRADNRRAWRRFCGSARPSTRRIGLSIECSQVDVIGTQPRIGFPNTLPWQSRLNRGRNVIHRDASTPDDRRSPQDLRILGDQCASRHQPDETLTSTLQERSQVDGQEFCADRPFSDPRFRVRDLPIREKCAPASLVT